MTEIRNYTTNELLKALATAFGPSGYEENVAEIIKSFVMPYADEVTFDGIGSVIAIYRARAAVDSYNPNAEPPSPSGVPDVSRLMLATPMDEPGFMIKSIDSDGYLKLAPLCGKNPKILAGRNVTVGFGTRKAHGYIGVKPTHLGGSGGLDSLYIDIGAKNKEDAEKYVKVGDFGAYRSDYIRFGKNDSLIKCKALDSRLGCAVLCEILRELHDTKAELPFDICFAFTCRDEITSSSAGAAARKLSPDAALLIRGESVNDISGESYSTSASLGYGAAVSIMDRGTLYDSELYSFITATAKKHSIPVQPKKFVSAPNGAARINRALAGVRCAEISIPVRYSRSAACVAAEKDFESVKSLALAFIKELSK